MKTQFTHTAGPWSYWPECCRDNGMVTKDGAGQHIAAPTHKEDGYILAAAPELLEALQNMTKAVYKVLALAQRHDPTTGFYKDVSPYELLEILQTAEICVDSHTAINKALGGDPPCSL